MVYNLVTNDSFVTAVNDLRTGTYIPYVPEKQEEIHRFFGGKQKKVKNPGVALGKIDFNHHVRIMRLVRYANCMRMLNDIVGKCLFSDASSVENYGDADYVIGVAEEFIAKSEKAMLYPVLQYTGNQDYHMNVSIASCRAGVYETLYSGHVYSVLTNLDTYMKQRFYLHNCNAGGKYIAARLYGLENDEPEETRAEVYGSFIYAVDHPLFSPFDDSQESILVYSILHNLFFRYSSLISVGEAYNSIIRLISRSHKLIPGVRIYKNWLIGTVNDIPVGIYNTIWNDPDTMSHFLKKYVPRNIGLTVEKTMDGNMIITTDHSNSRTWKVVLMNR